MSFEEIDTEDNANSLSEMSSLDDDLDRMHLESASSDEEMTDDEVDPKIWNEIESTSDAEFMEDHGLIEEVTSAWEDNTVNPIDCYRHFITDEIIDLMTRIFTEVGELWNSFTIPHFNIFYQRRTNSKGGVVVAVGKHLKATRIDIKTENTVIVDIDGLTEPVRVIGVYWPHCQNRNLDELSPFITGKTVLAMWPTVALSCNYCHCNALFCAIMRYNGNNYMIMQQSATWIAGDFNASVYE
ncbi:unnamed protein product [Rotaria sp. Silwood1]|nr:unnamed protein product [Rotaria sp. Silwood1]CAF1642831.1 unnamed protein product [Rotaria sp. Silwood1]CAF3815722.1 unnamed protein product [Rotaria sp. Silwood1]CAF3846653.1 unnamed protein product [Rotaria sp. Silwood1]CAF4780969.1 unnamed protein product [Rotaria sp. Silwood1]